MFEPLRSPEHAPEGALIRMTRDSPSGVYWRGDMAVKTRGIFADFSNLGNPRVFGIGRQGVNARYYLIVNRKYSKP